jgi:TPR repeat protein
MSLLGQLGRRASASAAAAAGFAAASFGAAALCETRGCPPPVHKELQKLRPNEAAMRKKWEEDESGWHKLPPRAWPPVQPKPHELDDIGARLRGCAPPDDPRITKECARSAFDLATCLIFNSIDVAAGLKAYRAFAERGDPQGMVGVGVVLVEGLGITDDREQERATREGVEWLRKACALGDAQGQYEMGVLYYLGSRDEVGTIVADEAKAYEYFALSAAQNHTSGCFMTAECLLEGAGCKPDPARAVGLLHTAAERGHRMARQYIREWLDEDAAIYGRAG